VVVGGTMGARVLVIYLVSIVVSALFMGWSLNWVYEAAGIAPAVQIGAGAVPMIGPLEIMGGAVLTALLAISAWRIRLGSGLLRRMTSIWK
jgi:hypothetical protein